MDVKQRRYGPSAKFVTAGGWMDVNPYYLYTVPVEVTGFQRTESEGHPFSRLKAKTGEDIGGEFKTQKVFKKGPAPKLWWLGQPHSQHGHYYVGPVYAADPLGFLTNPGRWNQTPLSLDSLCPVATPVTMASLGTTAIARTIPTNPVFSAAAFLGELREGLPSIPGRKFLRDGASPNGAASEYLNYQFGIRPFISDGKKFLRAMQTADKRLAQLYRDSGRNVRRRYTFPEQVTVEESSASGVYPSTMPGATIYELAQGNLTIKKTTTVRSWFSGAYTYFFPKQEGYQGKIAELEKTFGVVPDVSDLYQLTPWSWAVDWVSNLGDLVTNVQAFSQDSLVLRYGYIMRHSVVEYDCSWEGQLNIEGAGWRPQKLRTVVVAETKQRSRATPYGFGLNYDGFTASQQAIIAALGISRSGHR